MRNKISETFLDGVKSGFGAEQREPGRPDMCGNEEGPVAHLQNDLEKISRIESENGPPIGCDVPNTLKTFVELLNRIEVRKEYEVVDFLVFRLACRCS